MIRKRALGRRLRELPEAAGLMLEVAAPRLDWSTSTLSRIETAAGPHVHGVALRATVTLCRPARGRVQAAPPCRLALAEAARLAGAPLIDLAARDTDGNLVPLLTIVTDDGGPFRSFRCEAFIATHPELRHVRTRVRSPGQNASRERGFGTLNYERLFPEETPDVLDLIAHAEDYRTDYNTLRPHEALSWNRPVEVHTGLADPPVPNFPEPELLPTA